MRTIQELPDYTDMLAERYHKGQMRKDGQEYITHPRAVRKIAVTMYDPTKNYGTGLPLGQELPIIEAGCNLHDAMEDDRVTEAQLRKDLEEFPRFVVDMLIDGLQALNRKNFTSYDTYIINIYHLKNWTTLAKLSDLKHNSATLPPGSLKDKYALSEYILTH
jgi:(p)ppGpp synthase/HD superfamily hydrolase